MPRKAAAATTAVKATRATKATKTAAAATAKAASPPTSARSSRAKKAAEPVEEAPPARPVRSVRTKKAAEPVEEVPPAKTARASRTSKAAKAATPPKKKAATPPKKKAASPPSSAGSSRSKKAVKAATPPKKETPPPAPVRSSRAKKAAEPVAAPPAPAPRATKAKAAPRARAPEPVHAPEPAAEQDDAAEEKRARPWRASASADTSARIMRALSQRLFLVNREDCSDDVKGVAQKFAVLGSTGNLYDVVINRLPSCTCPDRAKGHLCKHIIFVMVRVLGVPRNSPLVYQVALLQNELLDIFTNAPETAAAAVQAKDAVVTAYKQTVKGEPDPAAADQAPKNDKVCEGDCPVCFEDLAGGDPVDSCLTCKNYIHKECVKMWLAVQTTCCYCRQEWVVPGKAAAAPKMSGGYLNLGAAQGVSAVRDTSTYNYHYNRNWYYRYRRWDN